MTTSAIHARAIDEIDDQLIKLLAQRFAHSRKIGEIKRAAGEPPYDPERLSSLIERFVMTSVDQGLPGGMAQQLISVILAQVLVERVKGYQSDAAKT